MLQVTGGLSGKSDVLALDSPWEGVWAYQVSVDGRAKFLAFRTRESTAAHGTDARLRLEAKSLAIDAYAGFVVTHVLGLIEGLVVAME